MCLSVPSVSINIYIVETQYLKPVEPAKCAPDNRNLKISELLIKLKSKI